MQPPTCGCGWSFTPSPTGPTPFSQATARAAPLGRRWPTCPRPRPIAPFVYTTRIPPARRHDSIASARRERNDGGRGDLGDYETSLADRWLRLVSAWHRSYLFSQDYMNHVKCNLCGADDYEVLFEKRPDRGVA